MTAWINSSCTGTVTALSCPDLCSNVVANVSAANNNTCGYTVAGSPLSTVLSASPGFLNPGGCLTDGRNRALTLSL